MKASIKIWERQSTRLLLDLKVLEDQPEDDARSQRTCWEKIILHLW